MNRHTTRRTLYAVVLFISAPLAFARGGYAVGQDSGYSPYQNYQCPYGYSCLRNNGSYGMMGPGMMRPGMMRGYYGMPGYGYGPGNSTMGPGMMGPGYGSGQKREAR